MNFKLYFIFQVFALSSAQDCFRGNYSGVSDYKVASLSNGRFLIFVTENKSPGNVVALNILPTNSNTNNITVYSFQNSSNVSYAMVELMNGDIGICMKLGTSNYSTFEIRKQDLTTIVKPPFNLSTDNSYDCMDSFHSSLTHVVIVLSSTNRTLIIGYNETTEKVDFNFTLTFTKRLGLLFNPHYHGYSITVLQNKLVYYYGRGNYITGSNYSSFGILIDFHIVYNSSKIFLLTYYNDTAFAFHFGYTSGTTFRYIVSGILPKPNFNASMKSAINLFSTLLYCFSQNYTIYCWKSNNFINFVSVATFNLDVRETSMNIVTLHDGRFLLTFLAYSDVVTYIVFERDATCQSNLLAMLPECPSNCSKSNSCFNQREFTFCCANNKVNSLIRACDDCWKNCSSCDSIYSCNLCDTGLFNNGTHCSPTCQNGTYPNSINRTCSLCPTGCAICNQTFCSQCNSSFFSLNSTCIESCPIGYWNNTNRACEACSDNCDLCYGSSSCALCSRGYYWNGTNCSSNCSENTYIFEETRQCFSCPITCDLCINNSINCRKSCFPGKIFINNSCFDLSIGVNLNFSIADFFVQVEAPFLFTNAAVFSWMIFSNTTNSSFINALNTHFSNQYGLNFTVPIAYFEPQISYSINCSYRDSENVNISKSIQLASLDFLIPSVQINPIKIFDRGIPHTLSGSIFFNNFYVEHYGFEIITNFNFTGTLTKTLTSFQVQIPVCGVTRNSIFSLTVKSYLTSNPMFSSSNESYFITGADPFTLTIDSLNTTQPYNFPIKLQSNLIFTGTCPDMIAYNATYTWTCSKTATNGIISACLDPESLFGINTLQNNLTIPTTYFGIDEMLTIGLVATKDNYVQSLSGVITITGDKNLILVIECTNPPCSKYNSKTDLRLKTKILNDPGFPISMRWNISLPVSFISFNSDFLINADVSPYGQNFIIIQVTVTDAVFYGTGKLTIPINEPPQNGSLIVNPITGDSLITNFDVRAINWEDYDVPITYQFFYCSNGQKFLLSSQSPVSNATTVLPGKIPSEEISFILYVMDFYNAEAVSIVNVTVSTPQLDFSSALGNILSIQSSLKSTDKIVQISQTSVLISQLTSVEDNIQEIRKNLSSCTGCPNNEKICDYGTCVCYNSSTILVDCTVSKSDMQQVYALKASAVSNLNNIFQDLDSNSPENAKVKETILSNINVLSANPTKMDDQVLSNVKNFLDSAITNSSLPLAVPQATQTSIILNNLLQYSAYNNSDCSGPACKSMINTTMAILDKVSKSVLENMIPGQEPYILSTPSYDLALAKSTLCNLSNVNLATSDSSPKISFALKTTQTDCNKVVNVQAYFFSQNLFNSSGDSSKKGVVMLKISDEETQADMRSSFNVLLKMPPGMDCSAGCDTKADRSCFCDTEIFDIRAQIKAIFQIANIEAFQQLTNFVYWRFHESAIFWFNAFFIIWLTFSLGILHFSKKIRVYCAVRNIKRKPIVSKSRGIFTMFLFKAVNSILSIYFIRHKELSKSMRVVLYYLKQILFSTYSAFFAQDSDSATLDKSFVQSFKNLNFVTMLLPYITVIPASILLEKLVIWEADRLRKEQDQKGIKYIFKKYLTYFTNLAFIGGCIFVMFAIAVSKSANAQISWVVIFLLTLIQDVLVNPVGNAILQYGVLKFKKAKRKDKSKVKEFFLRITVDVTCEQAFRQMQPRRKSLRVANLIRFDLVNETIKETKLKDIAKINEIPAEKVEEEAREIPNPEPQAIENDLLSRRVSVACVKTVVQEL